MTGPEFRHRVEAIASSFIEMRDDLEKEKRTISKHWAKRAKQLDAIIVNTSGMYGDLQGLGAPLSQFRCLRLATRKRLCNWQQSLRTTRLNPVGLDA